MKSGLPFAFLPALIPIAFSLPQLFYYVPVNMNWGEAQKYCRQHYTDLATIDSQTDVDELVKTTGTLFPGPVVDFNNLIWIGLHRADATAPWIWSDQSNSMFRSWDSGQPNNMFGKQFCAATTPDGLWNDWDCGTKYTSVCYSVRKRTIVRVEVKSSQNVNDPGMMTEILKKMEQKLKEEGLVEYATLSWRNQSDGNVFQKKEQKNVTLVEQTCSFKVNE
ncbi:L-selectin-like [Myxocyprinus asiaticus]|uniref:L-selectin-like n=1 Tax=Myxocyprinus asiaticus TaxID=70543 RepID=UPI0022221F53|nr:L-selectin-like [Myxocyprinus asiaticus]